MDELEGDELEATLLEAGDDGPDKGTLDTVRLFIIDDVRLEYMRIVVNKQPRILDEVDRQRRRIENTNLDHDVGTLGVVGHFGSCASYPQQRWGTDLITRDARIDGRLRRGLHWESFKTRF